MTGNLQLEELVELDEELLMLRVEICSNPLEIQWIKRKTRKAGRFKTGAVLWGLWTAQRTNSR